MSWLRRDKPAGPVLFGRRLEPFWRGRPYAPAPPTPENRPWTALTTAKAPALRAPEYGFTTLADGTVIAETDDDLSPLADALEAHVRRPYTAQAIRQEDVYCIWGREIVVAEAKVDGETIDISRVGGETTYAVDGRVEPASWAPAELVQIGEHAGEDFAVHAERVDGDLWQIDADPL